MKKQAQVWFKRHQQFLPEDSTLETYLDALQWSPFGIDAQATAKALLQDTRLQASHCYRLACVDGLEPEQIQALFVEAQKENAWYWRDHLDRVRCKEEDLISFWTHKLQGRLPEFIANTWAFRGSGGPVAQAQCRGLLWHGLRCECLQSWGYPLLLPFTHGPGTRSVSGEVGVGMYCSYYFDIVCRLLLENRFSELVIFLESMTTERYRDWLYCRNSGGGIYLCLHLVFHISTTGTAAIEPLLE